MQLLCTCVLCAAVVLPVAYYTVDTLWFTAEGCLWGVYQ